MSRPARAALLLLCTLALWSYSACSVVRQRASFVVPGDVPATDVRGRWLGRKEKQALADSLSLRIGVLYRCAGSTEGDEGVAACRELAARPDREVVAGELGALVSALPGVDCADVCNRRVELDSIVRHLGRPATPREYADRMAASGGRASRTREEVRVAYRDAIRTRYRLYAARLAEQIGDAEAIEVGLVDSQETPRRYSGGRIRQGLAETLVELGDRYAALEWQRFAGQPARAPVRSAREPASDPSPMPSPTSEPADGATPEVPGSQSRELCRRSCLLDQRACLARCRSQPIEGGAYDACIYDCTARDAECRRGCTTSG